MLKYFSKEKKKSQIISKILTLDEFFNRQEFEIQSDIWKMNSTQLEETINKQEKFIKHLEQLYIQQLEFLQSEQIKQEDNIKKLKNHIEELEIKNESNFQQKELMEQQYKEIYMKYQPKQYRDNFQQTESKDLQQEELIRLRNQCEKMSEEIQRLQEENDDVSVALETEKQHKTQIVHQYQQKIQALELQNQQLTHVHNKELEQLQIQLTQNFEIQSESKQKELESKVLQEKIKLDQKLKDCIRLEDEIKELKYHLTQQTEKYEQRESKLQLLESKRQRDKQTIQKLQFEVSQGKQSLQEQNLKLINELSKANIEISNLKDQLIQQQKVFEQQIQKNDENSDKLLKIQQLENFIIEQEKIIQHLEKKLDEVESKSLIKISELEKIIDQLNIKRENARKEIQDLNNRLANIHQDLNSSTSSRNSQKAPNIGHNKQKFMLFPTLKQMLLELRKKEDHCYKQYMKGIVEEFKNQKEMILLECVLNDVSRMTQDILDLLEEMGLI